VAATGRCDNRIDVATSNQDRLPGLVGPDAQRRSSAATEAQPAWCSGGKTTARSQYPEFSRHCLPAWARNRLGLNARYGQLLLVRASADKVYEVVCPLCAAASITPTARASSIRPISASNSGSWAGSMANTTARSSKATSISTAWSKSSATPDTTNDLCIEEYPFTSRLDRQIRHTGEASLCLESTEAGFRADWPCKTDARSRRTSLPALRLAAHDTPGGQARSTDMQRLQDGLPNAEFPESIVLQSTWTRNSALASLAGTLPAVTLRPTPGQASPASSGPKGKLRYWPAAPSGLAYPLTEDPKYARGAKAILLRFAEVLPKYLVARRIRLRLKLLPPQASWPPTAASPAVLMAAEKSATAALIGGTRLVRATRICTAHAASTAAARRRGGVKR